MRNCLAILISVGFLLVGANVFADCGGCCGSKKKDEAKKECSMKKTCDDAYAKGDIVRCAETGKYYKVCPKTGKKTEVDAETLKAIKAGTQSFTCSKTGKCCKLCPKTGKVINAKPKSSCDAKKGCGM